MIKPKWVLKLLEFLLPPRKVSVIEDDSPPNRLPMRNLILAREDGEDWAVGFLCPCGCKRKIELMLIDEVKPNWKLTLDERSRPTIHPSVWLKVGCKSHFWLRNGKIIWC
ncbi:DUF6527 family protein [Rheinheimera sp. EpRS3]|uniref:DUF6527 family protein n=1 Tax=Rheinheimera sp. EpRS3 TaxID=1712383 RepID=UPI00074A19E7|nr:DUF6527 family protein [Rheinheimera sp. EpRS3]KUM52207.1 hypothetical protein AR688_02570 [Rheinheimera sp. EpRS3]